MLIISLSHISAFLPNNCSDRDFDPLCSAVESTFYSPEKPLYISFVIFSLSLSRSDGMGINNDGDLQRKKVELVLNKSARRLHPRFHALAASIRLKSKTFN